MNRIRHAASNVPHARHALLAACSLVALAVLGAGIAQHEVTGTVEATVGGEERIWYTMQPDDESIAASATWSSMMHITMFNLRASGEPGFAVPHALTIDMTTFSSVDACPCRIPSATVTLWTDGGIMEKVYKGDATEVVVTRLEPLGDDVYELEGTIEATLLFHENIMNEPDPDRTLDFSGTFLVERLPFRSIE